AVKAEIGRRQGFSRIWFACGFPAFFAVIGILWLMLMKPAITLF
ncbi:DUF2269 family protein, partial [Rhizobium leguminosarum]